jgi:hypothetical protein
VLIACRTSRQANRRTLAAATHRAEIPTDVTIQRTEPVVRSVSWSEYWRPCRDYFEAEYIRVLDNNGSGYFQQLGQPEHLVGHMQQFGLDRFATCHFVRDGFQTKVHHYVITRPEVAEKLSGERLW